MLVILWIVSIISLAITLTPVVLYLKNRNKTNFAEEIRIVAFVDIAYLALWILGVATSGKLVSSASGVIDGILNLLVGIAVLYSVWKMKAGKGFKGLFKNPGINKVLFVVYLVANFVILYQLVITLINYLIFGIIVVVVLWIADRFLGLSAGTALMSGGGADGGGAHGHCGTCRHYISSKCVDNPEAIVSPMDSCGNYVPR